MAHRRYSQRAVYAVEWLDACGDDTAWQSQEKAEELEPPLCITVGFIVAKTASKLTLINSFFPADDTVGGQTVIPRGMVKSVRKVGVVKVRNE